MSQPHPVEAKEKRSPRKTLQEARQALVDRMTEVILATADVLEADAPKPFWNPAGVQPWVRPHVDPDLIRGFVRTPVYDWVVQEFLAGDDRTAFLCKVVELLHEVAPETFRQPRYT